MPPTWAAARMTYSGFSSSKKALTAVPSSRSTSERDFPTKRVYPFDCRFRQMADPTNPRWPATYILLFLSMIALFFYNFHIVFYHSPHQFFERCPTGIPSEKRFGLGGITQ